MSDPKALHEALIKMAETTPAAEAVAQSEIPVGIASPETLAAQQPAMDQLVPQYAPESVAQQPVSQEQVVSQQVPMPEQPVVQQQPAAPQLPKIPTNPMPASGPGTLALGPTSQFALQGKDVSNVAKYMGLEPQVDAASLGITEPSEEEVKAKVDQAMAPVRQAKADLAAAEKIKEHQDQDAKIQADIDHVADQSMTQLDNRVRVRSLPEIMRGGSTGDKIGAIVSVMLGGVAQGLTGAKSNPVLDMLDKLVEQQAEKDKLDQQEKLALRKLTLEQGELKLKELEHKTTDKYRKDQIEMQRKKLALEYGATQADLKEKMLQQAAQASKFSGKALSPEQEATLTLQERRNIVNLPDGRKVLTQSYEDANEYKKMATEINNAVSSIDELQKLGKKGSKWSLTDRATAKSLITKIVGGLRLPYTGPGVLTDNEREMLIETLGNPLAMLSFKGVEMAKLAQVRNDLLANLQNTASVRGIREDVTPQKFYNVNGRAVTENELVQAYKQKMPGLSDDKIIAAIRKTIPGL